MVGENSRYVRTHLYNRDDEFPMLGIRQRFIFNADSYIMRILNTDEEYDDSSGYVDEYDAYEDADYD